MGGLKAYLASKDQAKEIQSTSNTFSIFKNWVSHPMSRIPTFSMVFLSIVFYTKSPSCFHSQSSSSLTQVNCSPLNAISICLGNAFPFLVGSLHFFLHLTQQESPNFTPPTTQVLFLRDWECVFLNTLPLRISPLSWAPSTLQATNTILSIPSLNELSPFSQSLGCSVCFSSPALSSRPSTPPLQPSLPLALTLLPLLPCSWEWGELEHLT